MPSKYRRKPNKNRIVRVSHNILHHALASVALSTAYTYQECFQEWCNMSSDGYVLGVNTKDELYKRMIEKTPF